MTLTVLAFVWSGTHFADGGQPRASARAATDRVILPRSVSQPKAYLDGQNASDAGAGHRGVRRRGAHLGAQRFAAADHRPILLRGASFAALRSQLLAWLHPLVDHPYDLHEARPNDAVE